MVGRACAIHLLQGGANVREFQLLLGRAGIDTTALYTRVERWALARLLRRDRPA